MKLQEEAFEVRDLHRAGNIVPHLALAAAAATPLLLALYHPPFTAFVERQPQGSLKGFITAMSLVNAAFAIDVIGLFVNLVSREPALRITAHGVEGLYGWLRRKYRWDAIDHVSVGRNHIQFVRRSYTGLGLLTGFRSKGDKRRAGDQIYLKLSTADRDAADILHEIRKHRPELEIIASPYLNALPA